jgi:hypothetical protein
MLAVETSGVSYSKADHRKRLGPLLAGRTEKAIDYKWCNISAILDEAGLPWIPGFKPLGNYQERLRELTAVWLMEHPYFRLILGADR